MSNSLYITSLEAQSGKTVAALAFMEQLSGRIGSVSLFRPVVSEKPGSDALINLMMDRYGLRFSPEEMYGVTMADARPLLAAGKYDELYSRILERYKSLESRSEFVLCVGTDYSGVSTALEFGFNVEVARNLGSPLVPVVNGRGEGSRRTRQCSAGTYRVAGGEEVRRARSHCQPDRAGPSETRFIAAMKKRPPDSQACLRAAGRAPPRKTDGARDLQLPSARS